MKVLRLAIIGFFLLLAIGDGLDAQPVSPQPQAHSHNDYEQPGPLLDALTFGFTSVEADVHWVEGRLLVSHDQPKSDAPSLQDLYLRPLDSLITAGKGRIYPPYDGPFFLMIDVKTEAEITYRAMVEELKNFPSLICMANRCPVKIFISGNRAMTQFGRGAYQGIALDGRPGDLSKGYSVEQMPVISDRYSNWCDWDGQSKPAENAFERIRELADKTHREGKRLRLWAIPDHEKAWEILLQTGVDLINTDRLSELSRFLQKGKTTK
jgi:hypothetical protein